jgi:dTDP-4-dehydrorhamnose reductase
VKLLPFLFQVNEIKSISADQYPTPAKRLTYSALDCSKIERCVSVCTKPWQDSLDEMLGEKFSH